MPPAHTDGRAVAISASGYHLGPNAGPAFQVAAAPAAAYLTFLSSAEAAPVWKKYGFLELKK